MRNKVDSLDDITWEEFIEVLHDALGSKEARKAQSYYDHQEAKWDPAKQSIVDFHRYLTNLEQSFSDSVLDEYLYYQLWRQVLEDFREKLTGTNKPKTRDAIVNAIKELELDRKRDRSKSDVGKQPESKRPKHDRRSNAPARQNQGQNANPDKDKDKDKSKAPDNKNKPSKEGQYGSSILCFKCKKPGHKANDCPSNKKGDNAAPRVSAAAASGSTATSGSGKARASRESSQTRRCKDDQ
jgi:hypothetical protein